MEIPARLLRLLPLLALLLGATAHAQQVYFGVPDQWDDLIAHPDQWKYVREHADGFYINFIELNWGKQDRLNATAKLFTHKNGYVESDMNSNKPGETPMDADRRFIDMMHQAGFTITYTSLNYGWSQERADNLAHYQLNGEPVRPCYVQSGPWDMDGEFGFGNAQRKAEFENADGISTDGPIGLWQVDRGHMRENALMLVKYAHDRKRNAVIMISPYPADVTSYQPSQFLQAAQGEVHYFEDNLTMPDIWAVFEYATTIPAVPEEINGQPVNSSSGVAYWLLKHLHDPDHALQLKRDPANPDTTTPTVRVRNFLLTDQSPWLDLAPLLHLRVQDPTGTVHASLTLDDHDVTLQAASLAGLPFVGPLRLAPGSTHRLQVILKSYNPLSLPRQASVQLRFAPNISLPADSDQLLEIAN